MSKLPNAPLLEVIFELRWQIQQKAELSKYQYLIGDLYSFCKDRYPFRESLVPPDVPIEFILNNPAHRFRREENGYPLIQVGPGILTLNTDDENYYWEDFFKQAQQLCENFFEVFSVETEVFKPNLLYFDFIEFDFKSGNVHKFVNEKFDLTFDQGFLSDSNYPSNLDFSFFYEVRLGQISIAFSKGQNSKSKEGIIMKTMLQGNDTSHSEELLKWLDEGHEFTSNLFKEITNGPLYQSFKGE